MYHVYVLRSLKNGKRYVGLTSQDVQRRFYQHQHGTDIWTRHNGPFELVHAEPFTDRASAQRRERFLKSGHGREFLKERVPR